MRAPYSEGLQPAPLLLTVLPATATATTAPPHRTPAPPKWPRPVDERLLGVWQRPWDARQQEFGLGSSGKQSLTLELQPLLLHQQQWQQERQQSGSSADADVGPLHITAACASGAHRPPKRMLRSRVTVANLSEVRRTAAAAVHSTPASPGVESRQGNGSSGFDTLHQTLRVQQHIDGPVVTPAEAEAIIPASDSATAAPTSNAGIDLSRMASMSNLASMHTLCTKAVTSSGRRSLVPSRSTLITGLCQPPSLSEIHAACSSSSGDVSTAVSSTGSSSRGPSEGSSCSVSFTLPHIPSRRVTASDAAPATAAAGDLPSKPRRPLLTLHTSLREPCGPPLSPLRSRRTTSTTASALHCGHSCSPDQSPRRASPHRACSFPKYATLTTPHSPGHTPPWLYPGSAPTSPQPLGPPRSPRLRSASNVQLQVLVVAPLERHGSRPCACGSAAAYVVGDVGPGAVEAAAALHSFAGACR